MSKKALNVQDYSRRKGIQGNTSKSEIKCVCLNARSIINKKTELNIMVDDIKPHIIGITESWANNDITNAELGLESYVMSQRTINVWNKLSTDCVHASSVNMFKNKIDKYLAKAGYT